MESSIINYSYSLVGNNIGIDWASWITALSTFAMAIATIVMAIAAWQAKKGFLLEKQFNFGIELLDKYVLCYRFLTEKLLNSTPENREVNISQNHENIIELVNYVAKISFLFSNEERKKIEEILSAYLIYDREVNSNSKENKESYETITRDYANQSLKKIIEQKFKLGEK